MAGPSAAFLAPPARAPERPAGAAVGLGAPDPRGAPAGPAGPGPRVPAAAALAAAAAGLAAGATAGPARGRRHRAAGHRRAVARSAAPDTMNAWRLHGFGEGGSKQAAIDALKLEDVAVPALQPGQVLIKVLFAAVNPVDTLLFTGGLQGQYPTPCPYTPGFDVSGVVVASKGERLKEGDKVCAFLGLEESCRANTTFGPAGAFAEYCAAPEDEVALCGEVPLDLAAALPLSGLTAFQGLFTGGRASKVFPGNKVLVLGGPTAVGAHAIQLAASCGAKVFATASANPMPDGTSKIDFCTRLGATVINYKETDWSEELKGQDIELIFDCGGDNGDWQRSPKVLKKDGCFLTIANFAADPAELDGRKCEFFTVHSKRQHLETLLEHVADKRHSVPIDSIADFKDLPAMLSKSVKGAAAGKLIVKIPDVAP